MTVTYPDTYLVSSISSDSMNEYNFSAAADVVLCPLLNAMEITVNW